MHNAYLYGIKKIIRLMNKKHLCLVIVFVIIGKISGAQSWKNYEDSARTAAKSKNNKEIIKYYSLARTTYIKDKNKKDSTYIRLSGTLAAYFRNLNQFEEAENIFLELVNNIEKNNGRKSAEFVDNDLNLADVYLTTGQFPKAETVLLEATGIIPLLPGDNQLLLAQSYNTLAIMYRQIALYEKAEKFYLLTIDILEKQKGQEEGYAITINNLGVLYKFIGKFEDSEKYMLRAKDIKAKIVGTSHEEYALSCGTLGSLYKDIGRFDEAELLFKEACQIFLNKFGEINTDYAIFNTSLGDLYYQTGKYDLAEPCLLKAREILQKIFKKANPPVARVYSGLGVLYNSLGQYDKAIEVLIEAKSMMKEMYGETHPEFLIACNNLSGSYYKKDKLIEAEAIAMEAKSAFDKMPDVDPSINIMVNTLILNFKLQKGDYKEAEAIAIKMWSFADSIYGKESERFFLVCSNLGSLYKEINDKEKSIYYYRMALEAGEKSIGKYHPKIAFISSLLGSMYWSNGQLDKADSVFSITRNVIQYQVRQQFSFQSEKEKFQFIKTTEEDSRLLYSFFNDMHVPDSIRNPALLSLSLDNKAMLMESLKKMRAQILSSTDTVVTNIYNNWTKTREQLSYWLSRPLAERNGKDLELEERADKLEKELTKLSTDFSKQQSQKNISWQKIKDKLKPGEAAIEFLDYPFYNGSQFTDSTYYVCLVLRKDKPYPELVKLFEKKTIGKSDVGLQGQV